MTESTASSVLAGYQENLALRDKLAQSGTDFSEVRHDAKHQTERLHPKRIRLRLDEIVEETSTARTFRFVPTDREKLPPFQAGQYVNLFVKVGETRTARPFAISSAPQQRGFYDLTVRAVPGGFVSPHMLESFQVGDAFETSGPMGTFHYNPLYHGRSLVFLAGGSGIAPAMSMIEDFAIKNQAIDFHVIYGSRSSSDIIFRDRLQQLCKRHSFLRVDEVISEPGPDHSGHTGYLSAELISSLVNDYQEKMFYVCGPNAMYDYCLPQLKSLGIPEHRVRVEANGPPTSPERLDDWPQSTVPNQLVNVLVKGRGEFTTNSGEPLLNALERNGYQLENACRSGECSLCRIKVLKGEVFDPPQSKIRSSDRKFGWTHSCVAYPLTDIEILI